MRNILIALLVAVGFWTSSSRADQPATQPATQPAQADVYLIPFGALGGDNSLDWAGKAMQQNLLTDLARAKLHVASADKPIENTTDAQTAAQAAGAKYFITGTYQVADTLVRFTGQILDTASGKVQGGISATGAPRDLFNMEDAMSAQALQQLTHLQTTANNKPLPPALQPQIVVQLIQPPAVAQNGSSSSYVGSTLQQYVDANRTPSTDYNQQVEDAQNRDMYDYGYNTLYGSYFGPFGYGYGIIYSFPSGGHRFGYGYGWGRR